MSEYFTSQEQRINRTGSRFRVVDSWISQTASHMAGWRQDIAKSEVLYVKSPTLVDDFLEQISIKELLTADKCVRTRRLARQLIHNEIKAIPAQVYDSSSAENLDKELQDTKPFKDQLLMKRFGVACATPLPP